MSGVALKVLPIFPAQVTGVAPIVVTKSGLSYVISFNQLVANLAVSQIKQKLVADGTFDTVLNSIPSSPSNTVNGIWTGGGFTQPNGPLLTAIFTTLGLNAAQQAAFIAAAELFTF